MMFACAMIARELRSPESPLRVSASFAKSTHFGVPAAAMLADRVQQGLALDHMAGMDNQMVKHRPGLGPQRHRSAVGIQQHSTRGIQHERPEPHPGAPCTRQHA